MSKTAVTTFVYSFYLFLMGLGMIVIPNVILPLFGFPATTEIWIKMLGLFTFTTGIYYSHSSLYEQHAFFRATVFGRLFFFIMTFVFVIIYDQSTMLDAIGSIDLIGAVWTFSTLKQITTNPNDRAIF